ncbi:MAG: PrsW family glutamic-type intramembrane protease [Bacteroidales bacterium]|nr:PrsW family glutamic-type intramembrane protease [Bacteroidales bacterium]
MDILLLTIAIIPVIVLMIYVYKKDKYEKEPIGMLVRAFMLGILSIPIALAIDSFFASVMLGETVFFQAFFQAGIPEEFAKWGLFMLFIWKNKNFDEFFDGIVYACFIGLGFACVENILYVFDNESYSLAIHTGVMRALLSVPGHFLFAVIMGYYLGLAKFKKNDRSKFLIFSILFPIIAHGLFDYLLMLSSAFSENNIEWLGVLLYVLFIYLDIKMWKICLRHIEKLQEKSRIERNNDIFRKIFG